MQELSIEIENNLTVCQDLKGLCPLTLKAYRIDLKHFNELMQHKDCLSKECLVEYIDVLHKQYRSVILSYQRRREYLSAS